jgi:hypothetical protein
MIQLEIVVAILKVQETKVEKNSTMLSLQVCEYFS